MNELHSVAAIYLCIQQGNIGLHLHNVLKCLFPVFCFSNYSDIAEIHSQAICEDCARACDNDANWLEIHNHFLSSPSRMRSVSYLLIMRPFDRAVYKRFGVWDST